MERLYIKHNGADRMIGKLIEDFFVKEVKKSVHLFRKGDAWGLAESVFQKLLKKDCTHIIVKELEQRRYYKADIETFEELGWTHAFAGFEEQRFLPRSAFDKFKVSPDVEFIWGNREPLVEEVAAQPPDGGKVEVQATLSEQPKLFPDA